MLLSDQGEVETGLSTTEFTNAAQGTKKSRNHRRAATRNGINLKTLEEEILKEMRIEDLREFEGSKCNIRANYQIPALIIKT